MLKNFLARPPLLGIWPTRQPDRREPTRSADCRAARLDHLVGARASAVRRDAAVHCTMTVLPQPPLSVPLTAQLQSANGQCWEATFSRPGLSRNDGQDFKGNSD